MASRPTILVIPGSFSPAYFYNTFLSDLHALGFTDAFVRDLPSADRRPPSPAATLQDDATYFNHIINRLLAEGKDVVVLGHSYGGCVATEAVKGLTQRREGVSDGEGGKGRGRLLGTIYLTALMPKVGDSLGTMFDGLGSLEFLKFEGEYMYHSPARLSAEVNFSDIPIEEGIKYAENFRWHSGPSFQSACTYAGYEDVDNVAFIFCEKDKTLSPEFQQKMIDEAGEGRKKKGGKEEIKIYRLDSGHCPPASKPEELAALVGEAVGGMK